jgi:beta-galactosidase GanA
MLKPLDPDRIPLGVQYNRPPSPPENEWEADLAHIRRLGLDHIYIWVMWCAVEREPGKYSFDALERLVDLAASHGLDVILNLEPWAVPSWAERDEFRVVRLDGTPRPFESSVIHSLHAGRPCLDNHQLRALLEPFFRAAAVRFKDKPNLLCWKVWNEPDVDNCACGASIDKYQDWLRRKFGSLDEAAGHLKRHYRAWQDIKPPLAIGDTPAKLLYTAFRAWSATEIASWAIGIVRDADPDHLVLSDTRSTGTARLDLLADRMWNDWDLAGIPDIYGGHLHSAVGPSQRSPLDYARPIVDLECKRSASRRSPYRFWATEIPGGTARALGGQGMHENLLPGEMRLNLWTTIAHGAASVSPWQFKPERIGPEAGGWGMVEMDGTPTYRSEEVAAFVADIRRNEARWANARPIPSSTAILFSADSSITVSSLSPFAYGDAIQGIAAALWGANVQFDIVRDTDGLSQYKAVYIPMPWLIPAADLANLMAYVEAGGTVCAEAGFASHDDNGWLSTVAPKMGLSDRLGYRERDVFRTDAARIETRSGSLAGAGERRPFSLNGAEVAGVWTDGSPALARRRIGKGQFLYLATYPSLFWRTTADREGVAPLLSLAGIVPDIITHSDLPVTGRMLASGADRILLVFNHARATGAARITLPDGAWSLPEWLTMSPGSSCVQASSTHVDLLLEGKGVAAAVLKCV